MKRSITIIGSGVGGLAVGCRLAALGHQVTIYERNSRPGGKAAGVNLESYWLDSGPTILRMPHLISDLFSKAPEDIRQQLQLNQLPLHYRVYESSGGRCLDVYQEPEQTRNSIAQISPEDARRYDAFQHETARIYRNNLQLEPERTNGGMQKIKSGIGRSLSSAVPVLQATYAQFVERHFSHPLIQGGFLFHPIFFGQNPYTSPDKIAMIHAIERQWGVAYLQGGMRNLVRLLVDYFQRLSGKLYLGTAVDQIEVAKDRVTGIRLQDGEFRQADYIIANLSPYQTQARLIRTGTKPIQAGPKFGCSFMVMYLVVRDIPHREKLNLHTIIHPDGFSNNMQSVFHTDRFASSPWIYIYFPGVIESQATDDGTETMVVITPLPNLSLIEHTSKEMLTIRRKVLSALNTLLPGFEETIVHEKITSPRLLQETYDMDWGTHYQPIRPLLIDRLFFSGDSVWRGLGLVSALASAEEISRQISNE